jgi:hypothetical protein
MSSNIYNEYASQAGNDDKYSINMSDAKYSIDQVDKLSGRTLASKDFEDARGVLKYMNNASKVDTTYTSNLKMNGEVIADSADYDALKKAKLNISIMALRNERLNARKALAEDSKLFTSDNKRPETDLYNDADIDTSKLEHQFNDAGITSYEQNKVRYQEQAKEVDIKNVQQPDQLSLNDMEVKRSGDAIPERQVDIDDFVTAKFKEDKSSGKWAWEETPKVVAFRERENKLNTRSKSPLVASSMVAVADARGWSEMKVSGSSSFKKEVWMEASLRGIDVQGYTPTKEDKLELENSLGTIAMVSKKAEEKVSPQNTFSDNPVKLSSSQQNTKNNLVYNYNNMSRREAVKQNPELDNVYKLEKSAEAFASSVSMKDDDKKAFVDNVRDKAISEIAKGRDITPAKFTTIEHSQNINYEKSKGQGR